MAKIQKTANGKYEFWVDLGRDPLTGKRRQVHRAGFDTKKAAETEIRKLQNEADKGIIVQKQKANISFAEFADAWFDYYKATSGCKKSSINTRRNSLITLKKRFGSIRINDFTKHVYEKILIDLDRDYAKSTLSNMHGTMRMIFDYAVNCNLIAVNPTEGAKKPKQAITIDDIDDDDISEQYLSKAALMHLLATIKGSGILQDYALFYLLAFTGMRIGEVLALEVSRIDFDASKIKVRRTWCNSTNRVKDFYLQTPKTKSSIRDIDVDSTTLSILRLWISEQRKTKMLKRDVWYDDYDFVFTSRNYPGYPLLYATANAKFRQYLKAANLDSSKSLHILRHTHASLLAESGATLEQIQERLGHADDNITRRIYLHVTKNSKAKMMDQFANYMYM